MTIILQWVQGKDVSDMRKGWPSFQDTCLQQHIFSLLMILIHFSGMLVLEVHSNRKRKKNWDCFKHYPFVFALKSKVNSNTVPSGGVIKFCPTVFPRKTALNVINFSRLGEYGSQITA